MVRKAENSIELIGLLLISQDDRLIDEITIPPLLINNDSEYEKISVKFLLRFESDCITSESQY